MGNLETINGLRKSLKATRDSLAKQNKSLQREFEASKEKEFETVCENKKNIQLIKNMGKEIKVFQARENEFKENNQRSKALRKEKDEEINDLKRQMKASKAELAEQNEAFEEKVKEYQDDLRKMKKAHIVKIDKLKADKETLRHNCKKEKGKMTKDNEAAMEKADAMIKTLKFLLERESIASQNQSIAETLGIMNEK